MLPCIEEETDIDTTDDFTSGDETSDVESACTSMVGSYLPPDPAGLSHCRRPVPLQHPSPALTVATLSRGADLTRDPTLAAVPASSCLREALALFEEVGGEPGWARHPKLTPAPSIGGPPLYKWQVPQQRPNLPFTPAACAYYTDFPRSPVCKNMTASLREVLTLCEDMNGGASQALDFGEQRPVRSAPAPRPLPGPPAAKAASAEPSIGATPVSVAHFPREVMTLMQLSDDMWEA